MSHESVAFNLFVCSNEFRRSRSSSCYNNKVTVWADLSLVFGSNFIFRHRQLLLLLLLLLPRDTTHNSIPNTNSSDTKTQLLLLLFSSSSSLLHIFLSNRKNERRREGWGEKIKDGGGGSETILCPNSPLGRRGRGRRRWCERAQKRVAGSMGGFASCFSVETIQPPVAFSSYRKWAIFVLCF